MNEKDKKSSANVPKRHSLLVSALETRVRKRICPDCGIEYEFKVFDPGRCDECFRKMQEREPIE